MEESKKNKKPLSKTKKIINGILNGICILCFALTLYILASASISIAKTGSPKIFGTHIGVVGSSSMEPTIKTYSFIFYKDSDMSKTQVGDIIVFRDIEQGSPVYGQDIVHRVYALYDVNDVKYAWVNETGETETLDNETHVLKKIQTKGDNTTTNSTPDIEFVTVDNFKGALLKATYLFGIGKLRVKGNGSIIFILLLLCFVIIFISALISVLKQIILQKNAPAKQVSEVDKQKVIEEYLKKQEEQKDKN
jgi:signal peptidase I